MSWGWIAFTIAYAWAWAIFSRWSLQHIGTHNVDTKSGVAVAACIACFFWPLAFFAPISRLRQEQEKVP